MKHVLPVIATVLVCCLSGCGTDTPETTLPDIVAPGAGLVQRAEGFEYAEGPTADPDGNIYFCDFETSTIYFWSLEEGLSVFSDDPLNTCGLYFEKDGTILACAGFNRNVISIELDGSAEVVVDSYNGNRLNNPNDLWIHPDGGVYFTDPDWERHPSEIGGGKVFYLTPDRQTLIPVIEDIKIPNGIIGTADGSRLYVADNHENLTYRYDIMPDGSLANKTLFASWGFDGMTIDSRGDVYITGKSLTVYSPDGELIETIELPETSSNCCFGGPDNSTLFITTVHGLYSLDMQVTGVDIFD